MDLIWLEAVKERLQSTVIQTRLQNYSWRYKGYGILSNVMEVTARKFDCSATETVSSNSNHRAKSSAASKAIAVQRESCTGNLRREKETGGRGGEQEWRENSYREIPQKILLTRAQKILLRLTSHNYFLCRCIESVIQMIGYTHFWPKNLSHDLSPHGIYLKSD